MQDIALWKRIAAHQFDAPTGSAPFSVKLAQAEGWSKAFTNRVIEEYRRFVYLTQVSDAQVTPSEAVDRAWHMHLTFTRDYWDVFCAEVLGKPLHHEPCAGAEDMPRYRAQYEQTKALYLREFGGPAPADVWAVPIPWRSIIAGGLIGAVGLVTLLSAIVSGHGSLTPPVLAGYGLIAVGWGYAFIMLPLQTNGGSGDKHTSGCGGCGSGCGGCGG